MSTFVFIHGGMHGAWCWKKVITLLEQQGHNAIAIDLPGHGEDKTPLQELTLQSYVDKVIDVLDAQEEAVILVGHSMGGVTITQVAELRPDKIRKLVYLTALLPSNGMAGLELMEQDKESFLADYLTPSADGSYITIAEHALAEGFYGDCSEQDIALAKSLMVPEAVGPMTTSVNTSDECFGRVSRIYIGCLKDKAISPNMQRSMFTALPCEKVLQINTSHSPFFSEPEILVENLVNL